MVALQAGAIRCCMECGDKSAICEMGRPSSQRCKSGRWNMRIKSKRKWECERKKSLPVITTVVGRHVPLATAKHKEPILVQRQIRQKIRAQSKNWQLQIHHGWGAGWYGDLPRGSNAFCEVVFVHLSVDSDQFCPWAGSHRIRAPHVLPPQLRGGGGGWLRALERLRLTFSTAL
jgi:hypothetical protein